VVQDVLDSEACAIEFYSKMAEKYSTTDLVTHELFEDLPKDEVDDEEQWEKLMAKRRTLTPVYVHRGTRVSRRF